MSGAYENGHGPRWSLLAKAGAALGVTLGVATAGTVAGMAISEVTRLRSLEAQFAALESGLAVRVEIANKEHAEFVKSVELKGLEKEVSRLATAVEELRKEMRR